MFIWVVIGKLIKFVGEGEKMDNLDVFYLDWMVFWILGMGDMMILIEKVQENFDQE